MRPIKFRAWDIRRKQMCPVRALEFGYDGSGKTLMITVPPPEGSSYPIHLVDGESGMLVEFTGLYDKNGTEIYEGDVVLLPEQDNCACMRCVRIADGERFVSTVMYEGSRF